MICSSLQETQGDLDSDNEFKQIILKKKLFLSRVITLFLET